MTSTWQLSPPVLSYAIVAIGYAAFALQLWLRRSREARASWFLAGVVLGAAWGFASALYAYGGGDDRWFAATVVDLLRYGALYGFAISLLNRDASTGADSSRRNSVVRAVIGTVLLAAALVSGAPQPGEAATTELWAAAAMMGPPIYGLVLTEQLFQQTEPQMRWNVRPLCLGLAGLFIFDFVMYADAALFRVLDTNFWSARGFAHALVIPLLGIASARNKDWRFAITVSRGVLAGSTALFAAGAYLVVVAAVGFYVRDFGGDWGRTLQAAFLFAAVLLLLLVVFSGTFRSKMRVLVAKHFFAYRYDYREEWLRFARTLGQAGPRQSIHESCVRALADMVESPAGGIWLRTSDGGYAQGARIAQPRVDAIEPANSPFVGFLERSGWVVDVTDLRAGGRLPGDVELPAWLANLADAWLVVPLLAGESLIGFVVLSLPRVRMEVDWEVRDLLKTAGRQAASYVAQYEASEALIEARKFDAFNRMSAFVVHDLKNLVAQLQLLLRNAQRHRDNPDFQADMLKTVEHAVGRMNHLMLQLRSGTEPVESARPVEMAAVIDQVKAAHCASGAMVEAHAPPGVFALGHEDRLVRVIGHLVQNAIDAVRDNPRVSVSLARRGEKVVVQVTDNGVGMSAEFVRDSLFKPFRTTKHKGMGIGAYESHQYVTSLGGSIEVTSVVNQGTSVSVVLPAATVGALAAEKAG